MLNIEQSQNCRAVVRYRDVANVIDKHFIQTDRPEARLHNIRNSNRRRNCATKNAFDRDREKPSENRQQRSPMKNNNNNNTENNKRLQFVVR
jgi:hypothetical protein